MEDLQNLSSEVLLVASFLAYLVNSTRETQSIFLRLPTQLGLLKKKSPDEMY